MKAIKFFNLRNAAKTVAVLAVGLVTFAGCGGSGSSNRYLGEIPSLFADYLYNDSVFKAEAKAAVKNMADAEKYFKKEKGYKAKYESRFEAAVKRFKAVDVPVSTGEGAGFEVVGFKFAELTTLGEFATASDVRADYETVLTVKITDATAMDISFPYGFKYKGVIGIPFEYLNSEGDVIDRDRALIITENTSMEQFKSGDEFSTTFKLFLKKSNAKKYVDFAKVHFP
jgi:hypothetical protein